MSFALSSISSSVYLKRYHSCLWRNHHLYKSLSTLSSVPANRYSNGFYPRESNTLREKRLSINNNHTHKFTYSSSHRIFSSVTSTSFSNSRYFSTTTSENEDSRDLIGLFSIPGLCNPNDFLILSKKCIERCNDIRQSMSDLLEISESDLPADKLSLALNVLDQLDDISNEVCRVIDAAEMCRSVHTSEDWRTSASKAFVILSDYISDLNTDVSLYNALRKFVVPYVEDFNEEQQRMAILLKNEFERDGIHLPSNEREELKTIMSHITHLESMFTNNITSHKKYFCLPKKDVVTIIPSYILEAYVPSSSVDIQSCFDPNLLLGEETIIVSSDSQIVNTLLKYSQNPLVRREVYMQANTSCAENLEILQNLREQRDLYAKKLGFKSYAHKFLSDKMVKHPDTVSQFLSELKDQMTEGTQMELQILRRAKKQIEDSEEDIQPWDTQFYTGILKSQLHGNLDMQQVSKYLTLENCIFGMKKICEHLFGMKIKEVPMTKEETWSGDKGGDIKKLVLSDENKEVIGTLYLDLYPRPGKYVHAAHFTIQCGVHKKTHQKPIVALVCNLSSSDSGNSLLSHSEVETLYHEFGHALHSLLSSTSYQHLSGTRTTLDFVETPSHFMENYVWNPIFLQEFAKHYQTQEPMSFDLCEKLQKSRFSFQFLELQHQIVYALLDQELFGGSPSRDSKSIFTKLHNDSNLPIVEGTHWHSRFGHLVTYGAGYYGYLYNQIFAQDIWNHLGLDQDPLSRKNGLLLKEEILTKGGTRDPNLMLQNVLGGRSPNTEAFFKDLNDARPAIVNK